MSYLIETIELNELETKSLEKVGAHLRSIRRMLNKTLFDVGQSLGISIAGVGKKEKSCSYQEITRACNAMNWPKPDPLPTILGMRPMYKITRLIDGAIMSGVESAYDTRQILVETPEGQVIVLNVDTREVVHVYK